MPLQHADFLLRMQEPGVHSGSRPLRQERSDLYTEKLSGFPDQCLALHHWIEYISQEAWLPAMSDLSNALCGAMACSLKLGMAFQGEPTTAGFRIPPSSQEPPVNSDVPQAIPQKVINSAPSAFI